MNRIMSLFVAITLCFLPIISYAQTNAAQNRAAMLQLIELLTEEIRLLKLQLTLQANGNTVSVSDTDVWTPPSLSELLPSRFYTGTYAALYAVHDGDLVAIDDTHTKVLHTALWQRFRMLLGDRYRELPVQEFRIYVSASSPYDAFTERDERTGAWIVAVNTYRLDMTRPHAWDEMDQLFLHEIGHMIVDTEPEILDAFTEVFWDDEGLQHADRVDEARSLSEQDDLVETYYKDHVHDFVSEYAATNPLEDAVESFSEFIIKDPVRSGTTKSAQKMAFFLNFQDLVAYRASVQDILQ